MSEIPGANPPKSTGLADESPMIASRALLAVGAGIVVQVAAGEIPFMADLLGNAAVPLTVWPIVFGGALLAWALIEGIALLAWRGHEVPEDPS